MTTVCEIAFVAGRAETADRFICGLAAIPELEFLDHYAPAAGTPADPYCQDGVAPAQLVLLGFHSRDALEQACRHPGFAAAIAEQANGVLTCTAMRRIEHRLPDAPAPAPLAAPFSYVVRYHRPAEDEELFVRHYLETHPPLLVRFPGIRNVICYIPLRWQAAPGIANADYMLGNEVVFDHLDAFNAAMTLPLRHELRAHFRALPPFTGRNTHYAMERRRVR